MDITDLFARFYKATPFAVLTRCLAQCFISEELNQVFDENRGRQYQREVSFAAIALAVADVSLNFAENFNQAYKSHRENLGVAVTSFYNKIKATNTRVSEAIVAKSAAKARELQDALGFEPWEILPGYNVLAFDGNHLAKTDKRLKVLRDVTGAPLPGTCVACYDLQRELFCRAYLLEDAHNQEALTCPRIVEDLEPNDVVMADRHFCIVAFMIGIASRNANFVLRQNGRLKGVLLGKRRRIGRISTGMVHEQSMRLSSAPNAMVVRRITIELDEPTRDGDTIIHLLTNLPKEVNAKAIAESYRHRWDEETAFNRLQMTLTCELESVGHPRAALFLFCLSMFAFNMRQVVFAALYAEHDEQLVNEVSHYHISVEVARYTDGMLIALDDAAWEKLIPKHIPELAQLLRQISRGIDLKNYKKSVRGPKKKKPVRSGNTSHSHVSTAKLLGLPKNKDP